MAQAQIDERQYLDPLFLQDGQEVYTYEFAELLRKENLELKSTGKRLWNITPQAGFQEEVLTSRADIVICGGSRGGGKVLPNDTDIVTPFGYRKNGDLEIGDILIDPYTGGFEHVIQIFEHPNHDFYQITFDDGSTVECGLEHLWKVRETGHSHKTRKINGTGIEADWRIWDFSMIKKWLDEQAEGKHFDRGRKKYLVIPVTEPVKFTRSTFGMKNRAPFDPYIIGALIGDGCMTYNKGAITLTSIDKEIVEQFLNAGFDMSHFSKDNRSKSVDYRLQKEQIEPYLERLGLMGCRSEEKFIPSCYKWGTVSERWAIVQGLMDTDGTTDKAGNSCYFNTSSEKLANDMRFVLESLGANVAITRKKKGYKKDGQYIPCLDTYELYIKIKDPRMLFRLSRKKDRCQPFNGGVSEVCRRIVSYRHVGKKDGRCITVDSPNALYMAKDFVVTHNTACSLIGAVYYAENPDINMYGFRRYEADVKRGIWKSCKPIFRGAASFADTSFEAKFFNGNGAMMKMEHLADLSKIKDRFRGAEMPYIVIEELAEFTKDNMNVIFDLIGSNRSTTGLTSRFICTTNPVGRSNKLRWFLEWWIDPDTDKAIPARSGKIRYFCRYGEDVMEIAWGNTPEEVYDNPNAKRKIQSLSRNPDTEYKDYITSITFIDGDYSQNLILQVSDPKYMNRISSGGSKSVINDIVGVWRDIDDSAALITMDDMNRFCENAPQTSGIRCAGGDIAYKNDWFVLWAMDGWHIIDVYAKKGVKVEDTVGIIRDFLNKNEVPWENFAFDGDGVGVVLKTSDDLAAQKAHAFSNKGSKGLKDSASYRSRKSECAGLLISAFQTGKISIDEDVLRRSFKEKGVPFTVRDKLVEERIILKWIEDQAPRELIKKSEMKGILGHSPDWIEALLYCVDRVDVTRSGRKMKTRGLGFMCF